jgi:succinate dehydrogenase / fumarate reductase cytochrome b subunit
MDLASHNRHQYRGDSTIEIVSSNLKMSSAAAAAGSTRAFRFFEATIVKKAIVAVTGLAMLAFVTAHLLGNLQVFLGPERLNSYSAFLKGNIEVLWGARIGLLVCLIAHVVATIQLWQIKNQARPVGYVKKRNSHSSLASRTMYYSGPVILAFVIYHLLHFTVGAVHPHFSEQDVYSNVVYGFLQWPVSLAYIVAVGLLCLHLSHGIWSMFQTLGFTHPRYTPRIRSAARAIAILFFVGYASIPLGVLTGVVRLSSVSL